MRSKVDKVLVLDKVPQSSEAKHESILAKEEGRGSREKDGWMRVDS